MVDAERFRAILNQEREQKRTLLDSLRGDIRSVSAARVDSNVDDEHDPEGSTIAFELSQAGALMEQSRAGLEQIEAALARIDDGTYGVCESCGNPIGKMRLMAFPRATLCMTCKQREERR